MGLQQFTFALPFVFDFLFGSHWCFSEKGTWQIEKAAWNAARLSLMVHLRDRHRPSFEGKEYLFGIALKNRFFILLLKRLKESETSLDFAQTASKRFSMHLFKWVSSSCYNPQQEIQIKRKEKKRKMPYSFLPFQVHRRTNNFSHLHSLMVSFEIDLFLGYSFDWASTYLFITGRTYC